VRSLSPAALRLGLPAAAVLALLAPACGGDDSPLAASVEVTAIDNAFEPASLSVPAGRVEFTVVNEGAVPHTFVIAGIGFKLKPFDTGAQASGVAELEERGEVLFYCDIEGHREDGMEGVLTVEED
jgi:plastocyanin